MVHDGKLLSTILNCSRIGESVATIEEQFGRAPHGRSGTQRHCIAHVPRRGRIVDHIDHVGTRRIGHTGQIGNVQRIIAGKGSRDLINGSSAAVVVHEGRGRRTRTGDGDGTGGNSFLDCPDNGISVGHGQIAVVDDDISAVNDVPLDHHTTARVVVDHVANQQISRQ